MNKFLISLVSILAVVVVATPSRSDAAEARRLLPLKVMGDKQVEDRIDGLTQAMVRQLVKYPDVRMQPVPSDDPLDIMLEAGCEDLDEACLKTIGSSAGVDEVLLLVVENVRGMFRVTAHMVSVAGGKSMDPEVTGNSGDQLEEMVAGVIVKTLGPVPEVAPVVAPVVTRFDLSVASDPSGAEVFVNGDFSGMTPVRLSLEPAEYEISVQKDGYISSTQQAIVRDGSPDRLEVKLDRKAPVAAAVAPVAVVPPAAAAAVPAAAPAPAVAAPVVAPVEPVPPPVVAPVEPLPPPVVAVVEPAPMPEPVAPPAEPIENRSSVKSEPVYKKWWFWTIIGVAVVGAGTIAGILASQGDSTPGEAGFSPWGGYAPRDVTLYPMFR